ncbi:hypothetical protein [Microbulbifer halophilus]|uniref:Uncharacterized protein n=2 Tax=Microbulbifer halophilus TaxID=453963 RepID=A0ABW5EIV7_9GAMM|nr:hypothetical protein [Microbulbifer halophilus]MCW8128687.1 hypothetical protein [Microbulbifer halophilus]
MTPTYEYLHFIERLENTTFGKKNNRPILLEDVSEFIDFYFHASKDEKSTITSLIQGKIGLTLISYSGEMSAMAIDTNEERWLEKALMLHIIEGFKFDYRENIRRLVFINHAANRIGVELFPLAKNLFNFASNDVEKRLLEFFDRPQELNSLNIYGMQEVKVKNKTKFKPTT